MPEYYDASIRIDFKCLQNTFKLVLHMKDLKLDNSTLYINSSTHKDYVPQHRFFYTYDNDTQMFTAEFAEPFKQDNIYSFYVEFRGFLESDNKGLYRSSYINTFTNENDDFQKWFIFFV